MTHTNGIGSTALAGGTIDKLERTGAAERNTSKNTVEVAGKQGTDAASLSGAGSLLASAMNTDDVRTSKVEALKAAINNGTYNVPAADVADKLISSMLE